MTERRQKDIYCKWSINSSVSASLPIFLIISTSWFIFLFICLFFLLSRSHWRRGQTWPAEIVNIGERRHYCRFCQLPVSLCPFLSLPSTLLLSVAISFSLLSTLRLATAIITASVTLYSSLDVVVRLLQSDALYLRKRERERCNRSNSSSSSSSRGRSRTSGSCVV